MKGASTKALLLAGRLKRLAEDVVVMIKQKHALNMIPLNYRIDGFKIVLFTQKDGFPSRKFTNNLVDLWSA